MFKNYRNILTAITNGFDKKRILVIGDIMLDSYIGGKVERISPEAPVPIIKKNRQIYNLGGAGNVAHNLANLGLETYLAGFIGNDDNGDNVLELCVANGINARLIRKSRFISTITKTRILGDNYHQLFRIDEEEKYNINSNDYAELRMILKESRFEDFDVIVLSDYGKGCLNGEFCQFVIDTANGSNTPVLIDPKGSNYEKYKNATLISPNKQELSIVVGVSKEDTKKLCEAGEKLRDEINLEKIILTMSENGITLIDDKGIEHFPAIAKEIYDVSGAGDTVISILAACRAVYIDIRDAIKLANLAAGIVVAKAGTVPIGRQELLKELVSLSGEQIKKNKIGDLKEIKFRVQQWRNCGEKIVLTNGCFDLIHSAHIRLLQDAKAKGDRLVVALNSDISVRKLKGDKRPIIPQDERSFLLSALEVVDSVVIFDEETPLNVVNELKPDVLVKGGDYKVEEIVGYKEMLVYGGKVITVPLIENYSTTNIINKILQTMK